MTTLRSSWQLPGSVSSLALQRPGRPWAQALLQPSVWMALFGALCVLALLLAFRQVVLRGVQQSELRHRATAAHADGVWRCNALRTVSQRAPCRVQLDAAHAAAARSSDHGDVATMPVVHVER
jgi:hypothetical protein